MCEPVDLQIIKKRDNKIIIAIEVADVNSPQLVGEICRLYYDKYPRKMLVLGYGDIPENGVEKCNKFIALLYGQDNIKILL